MREVKAVRESGGGTPGAACRALPPDSLAFALLAAAQNIAAVIRGGNLNEALARCWREHPALSAGARGAIQDLSYGTLRDYGRGDFFLRRLINTPLQAVELRALLLAALYRLVARPQDAHTTVDQAVRAAATLEHGKYKSLTNAVLRNFLRQHAALTDAAEADEVAHWRHPHWWVARLRCDYPDQWQSVLAAGNERPPMTLRVNRRKTDAAAYLAQLSAAGIAAQAHGDAALLLAQPVGVGQLPGFAQGWCSVQDLGAQHAAALLDVADGMRVLDACAAPGGKTAHILECADVSLTALEIDATRLARVDENLTRLGLAAQLLAADCRAVDAWWDGVPFDRILADVPCSASGVVRRHPDIKWLRRETDIAQFAATQAEILTALWRVLAPDGKLLYATCSVFPEENERQVAAFTARHADCLRLTLNGDAALQLLPRPEHDGFFYALLQKRAR